VPGILPRWFAINVDEQKALYKALCRDIHKKAEDLPWVAVGPGNLEKRVRHNGLTWLVRQWTCCDCGGEEPRCPMIRDKIWAEAGYSPRTVACRGCLEKRLGRALVENDLEPMPLPYVGGGEG